ncbi:MAG TPA: hypothetical protein VN736_15380 [Candidatus Limnocylindrales bacterium]|nr:hypothetical protein [Candidatus Limnocylindrales bacterium]
MITLELSAVSMLLAAYALWIFGMFIAALLRGAATRRAQQRAAELEPKIREVLIHYLAGAEDRTEIRNYVKESRAAVSTTLLSFQTTISGGARDRLCELALDQGLVHEWCQQTRSKNLAVRRAAFVRLAFACSYEPCRRVGGEILLDALNDADDEIRLEACRALVQAGVPEEVESVFEAALGSNPLIRILLAEDLRRHAAVLCKRAVPEALRAGDSARVLAALDVLVAWERALPLRGLFNLLQRDDPQIRIQTLHLAPLVEMAPEDMASVLDALADPDERVVLAAAQSVGRLRLQNAMTALARCLRTGNPELARVSAAALAEIPGTGAVTLEELSDSSNRVTALAAREALGRARQRGGM